MTQYDSKPSPSSTEVLTPIQQEFANYIASQVKPVEVTLKGLRSPEAAKFAVKPHAQLIPVNEVVLKHYTHVPQEGDVLEGEPLPDPYTVWVAELKNKSIGIDTSLALKAHEGFVYTGAEDHLGDSMSDEFGLSILDSIRTAQASDLLERLPYTDTII